MTHWTHLEFTVQENDWRATDGHIRAADRQPNFRRGKPVGGLDGHWVRSETNLLVFWLRGASHLLAQS